MKDRLKKLIEKLNGIRDEAIGFYLTELEAFTPNDGNPKAAMRAGIMHDLDKHITNLEMEVKRIEALDFTSPSLFPKEPVNV